MLARRFRPFVVLVTLLLGSTVTADPIADGLGWLHAQQRLDGSFGSFTGEDTIVATHEALAALRALGEGASGEAQAAEDFLSAQHGLEDSELRLRRQTALVGTAWEETTELLTGAARGFDAPDARSLTFAMQVLRASGQGSSAQAYATAQQLLNVSGLGGCYGYVDGAPSAELTGRALLELDAMATRAGTLSGPRDMVLACLTALQQPGGAFDDVAGTATAMLALQATAQASGNALADARQFLLASQAPSGSWGGVRATALALRALGAAGLDWRVPQAAFTNPDTGGVGGYYGYGHVSPASIEKGQLGTFLLDVTNASAQPAPAVPVHLSAAPRFYLGVAVPAVDLGTFVLPAMTPGESRRESFSFPTTDFLPLEYRITAVIDPLQQFPDLDRSTNNARAHLSVYAPYDLAVTRQSITFAQPAPGVVEVSAVVRNLGRALPQDVTVEMFKGGRATGQLIASGLVPSGLGTNQTFTLTGTIPAAVLNGATAIHVEVDAADMLPEASEDNNHASRFYESQLTGPTDLSIASFSASPLPSIRGQPTSFSVVVRNGSTRDVSNVPVALSNDTNWSGLAAEIPYIPAGSTAVATFSTVVPSNLRYSATVDVDGTLNDPNRANNVASVQVTLADDTTQELSVQYFTPFYFSPPAVGTRVLAGVMVQNQGSVATQTTVRVTDEQTGAELLARDIVLKPNEAVEVPGISFIMPSRVVTMRACVDAFDTTKERNERDNCAERTLGGPVLDLSVATADIQVTPLGPDVGEPVHITGTVHNAGAVDVTTVVELHQGQPGTAEGKYLDQRLVTVPGQGAATVDFDWIREDGPVEIWLALTRTAARDSVGDNNRAARHLFLEQVIAVAPHLSAHFQARSPEMVVSGRLTGSQAPELVVGYQVGYGFGPFGGGAAVLQRQPDGGYSDLFYVDRPNEWLADIALVDFENDGAPELYVESYTTSSTEAVAHLGVYRADGSTKWETSIPGLASRQAGVLQDRCLGDMDGDGIVDITLVEQAFSRSYSGSDGAVVRDIPYAPNTRVGPGACMALLDVDGDGTNEIHLRQLRGVPGASISSQQVEENDGGTRWSVLYSGNWSSALPIADLDGDGVPELVRTPYPSAIEARSLATGAVVAGTGERPINAPVIGAARQDGRRYVAGYSMGPDGPLLLRSDLTRAWKGGTSVSQAGGIPPRPAALADILGLGRPQAIYFGDNSVGPYVFDARDGTPLLEPPRYAGSYAYFHSLPPVIADLAGDGTSRITVASGNSSSPGYGRADAIIYGSVHWKKMPTAWPTKNLIKGRIGEDLAFAHGAGAYRWWTTHNTWNQQFDLEPEHLLPDFRVAMPAQGPATAGQPFTLTATVTNEGGLDATDVPVAFYDGDPAAGGTLLGTAVVAGPLSKQGGTATASFTWPVAWPEGQRRFYAVANPDGALEEVEPRDDNTASVYLLVRTPSDGCDLAVDAASLSVAPAAFNAGDALSLTATVRNAGTVDCAAAALTVYDGLSPVAPVAGVVPIPLLPPGASTVLVAPATAGQGGLHLFRFVADAEGVLNDIDDGNDEAVLEAVGGGSSLPDLFVEAVQLAPEHPYPGQPVQVQALVRNRGAFAQETSVDVTLSGRTATVTLRPLDEGDSETVVATVTAPVASATGMVTVDPSAAIPEFDETNNTTAFFVAPASAPVLLSATAVPAAAGANTPVRFDLSLANTTSTGLWALVRAQLLDATGGLVGEVLTPTAQAVGTGASVTVSPVWNTGAQPPGVYVLHAVAAVDGEDVAAADAVLTITGGPSVSLALAADRRVYAPGGAAVLTGRLSNTSGNVTLTGATAVISVVAPGGALLQQTTRNFAELPPGASKDVLDLFEVGPLAVAGTWGLSLEVVEASGTSLGTVFAGFEVATPPGGALTGTVTAPGLVTAPLPLVANLSLTNASASDLTDGLVEALLLDGVGPVLAPVSGAASVVSLAAGASTSLQLVVPTNGLPAGLHVLVLRVDGLTLDSRLVEVQPQTDFDPPLVEVNGVMDGEVRAGQVQPVLTVTDASPTTLVALLDGSPWAGAAVTADGAHLLQVTAADAFGNTTYVAVHFTIDTAPPTPYVAGVSEAEFAAGPVTIAFGAVDDTQVTVTATLNGVPFTTGDTVSVEGEYTLVVTATDEAGNQASLTVHFAVDTTPPAVTLSGVADGAIVNTPVTLTYTATDAHLATVTALVDGVPFFGAVTVSTEGAHHAEVTAADAAGNSTTVTRDFVVDTTPPVITLFGVAEGAVVNTPVTLTWQVTDAQSVTEAATLDGVPVAAGVTLSTEGAHLLEVTATDAAGNASTATRAFAIDTQAPVLFVTVVASGAYFSAPVSPNVTVSDAHPASLVVTLDGAPYTPLTPIVTEGAHVLAAQAADAAGNTASLSVPFTLDFTAPLITVSGVADGATGTSFTPVFSVTDTSPVVVTATVDGVAFASGTAVTAVGAHTLTIVATDAAGNTASRSVSFTVTSGGGGRACVDTTLVATREYTPTRWHDATLSATPPFRFVLPATLPVTRGRSSNKEATLEVTLGCRHFSCKYRGGGRDDDDGHHSQSGREYEFDHCTGQGHELEPGDEVTATSLTLHVHNGDHAAGTTEVRFTLTELRPCAHAPVPPAPNGGVCEDDDDDDDEADDSGRHHGHPTRPRDDDDCGQRHGREAKPGDAHHRGRQSKRSSGEGEEH